MALTEGQYAGEFILSEQEGDLSREQLTVLSGQNLKAGAVIGRVGLAAGKMDVPAVVGTGNGTMSVLYPGPEVQKGSYVVKCKTAVTNGGVWTVTCPDGKALPDFTMTPGAGGSTTYRGRHVNFTITDGGTDFIVNDTFTIVVGAGTPTVVGTGNGTISAISLGPAAKTGEYLARCVVAVTNGGTFEIVGPTGAVVAEAQIVAGAGGTLVLSDQQHLNITFTDAGTDFAVGDVFHIPVYNELVKKAVAWDPTTFDGRHKASGVLYGNVDASLADIQGVALVRMAVVLDSALQYAAAITAAQKVSAKADLAALGIVAR